MLSLYLLNPFSSSFLEKGKEQLQIEKSYYIFVVLEFKLVYRSGGIGGK